jgi:hypothetical protein
LRLKKKTQQWPRRRRCRRRICRRKFLSWGAARCKGCRDISSFSRSLKRKEARKRPGFAPNRSGVGWRSAQRRALRKRCAICGEGPRKRVETLKGWKYADPLCIDHVCPWRWVEEHTNQNPHARENLICVHASEHGEKTAVEHLLFRGRIVQYVTELNRIGFPMERVKKAMTFYDLGGSNDRGIST